VWWCLVRETDERGRTPKERIRTKIAGRMKDFINWELDALRRSSRPVTSIISSRGNMGAVI